MTIITLSNGKKVGNFSSPHPFIFEDGSVLPAVSPEEAERLKVEFIETTTVSITSTPIPGDVDLAFNCTDEISTEIDKWIELWQKRRVDVVFCPLPMIIALKETYGRYYVLNTPFRAIRIEDRIKKLVSIHKQCV